MSSCLMPRDDDGHLLLSTEVGHVHDTCDFYPRNYVGHIATIFFDEIHIHVHTCICACMMYGCITVYIVSIM